MKISPSNVIILTKISLLITIETLNISHFYLLIRRASQPNTKIFLNLYILWMLTIVHLVGEEAISLTASARYIVYP